ncbi:hypothetical protein [Brevundimonas sp.]|uniref:hypothetical protein n=1 Tax=Brevundimonas sp. TaxID=1871086 RepID=UPI003BAB6EC1
MAAPVIIALLKVALMQGASVAAPEPHAFVLAGAGRFAVLADLTTRRRQGDIAEMRSLQVSEEAFKVGDVEYWGGWSRWRFDCAAMTADRLDFASLRADGAEGPSTPEPSPAYPAAPGGDAAELLVIACSTEDRAAEVTTVEDAVSLGRTALAQ